MLTDLIDTKIHTEEKVRATSSIFRNLYLKSKIILFQICKFSDSSNTANRRTSYSRQLGRSIGNSVSREICVIHKWCTGRTDVPGT